MEDEKLSIYFARVGGWFIFCWFRFPVSIPLNPTTIISVFQSIFCKSRLLWHVVFYLHRGILRNQVSATASLARGVLSTPRYSAESDVSDDRKPRLGRHDFSVPVYFL